MTKRRGSKLKAGRPGKKMRRAAQSTRSRATNRKVGFGTEISAHFRGIGLRKGEEIQELHDIKLQIPNFEE
jgi:hypothetical protein